jgi:triosephosphate isomerase (TIM)
MKRKKIVAANWKMNLMPAEGHDLITSILKNPIELLPHQQVIFCAPYTHLTLANQALQTANTSNYCLGAQNCNANASGAYTGEISIDMLKSFGVSAIIVGHSERREYFAETNEMLAAKTDAILANAIMPIFCCGEPLAIRQANTQNEYVQTQLQESLWHLNDAQMANVVIAYEPIWAIGTGVTASVAQAQDMHAFIRSIIAVKYGEAIANNISILYGGSCNASNATDLFAQSDIDGGLIGGASLKAETFLPIIQALQ